MASIRWGLASGADVNVPFSGNSALSGCRLIDAGAADDQVALAWNELAVDANTVALWRFNGDYLDSSGNGYTGTPAGSAAIVASGMDRELSLPSDGSYIDTRITTPAQYTVEAWAVVTALTSQGQLLSGSGAGSNVYLPNPWWLGIAGNKWYARANRNGGTAEIITAATPSLSTLYHVALTADASTLRLWINGALLGSAALSGTPYAYTYHRIGNYWKSFNNWRGRIDELRVSNTARYSATFAPMWYKSATQNSGVQPYAQVSHSSLSGMVPVAVSWSATTGAGYGQVKAVYVQDASLGWVQVGGDYPTSPVAISGLVLAGADAVRVALEPKADAMQSETPILDWLHLDYAVPVTGYARARYPRLSYGHLIG